MKTIKGIFLAIIIFFTCSIGTVFAIEPVNPSIDMIGEGAVLIEENSGKVLFEKNMNKKMYPASTTKIMTALLALEYGELEEIITVGDEIGNIPEDSSKANLYVGQQISLMDLLYGLMLPSGNDAANTIAVYIARKTTNNNDLSFQEAIQEFSILMNNKAKELGAKNTHFINPHGYHDENHYTTPLDMAMIAREAMKKKVFREIVKTPSMSYLQGENKEDRTWVNSNELIHKENKHYYPYSTGIKTGRTESAGRCLVSAATKGDLNIIGVVYKSTEEDIWGDSVQLLSYGIENFQYYTFAQSNEVITKAYIKNGHPQDPSEINVVTNKAIKGLLEKKDIEKIEERIIWDNVEKEDNKDIQLSAPIIKGEKLGHIVYSIEGEMIAQGELVAQRDIRRRNIFATYWWISIPIVVFIIWGKFFKKSR